MFAFEEGSYVGSWVLYLFDGSYVILYRYACCHCQKWFIFQTLHFNFSVVSVPEWKGQPHVLTASRKHIWQQCQRKGGHLLLATLGAIDVFPEHHRQQSLWQVLSLSDFTLDMCISFYKREAPIDFWNKSNIEQPATSHPFRIRAATLCRWPPRQPRAWLLFTSTVSRGRKHQVWFSLLISPTNATVITLGLVEYESVS